MNARQQYQAANIEAAHIIAADPKRYPGLLAGWAALVIERAEAQPAETEAGPLFAQTAA